MVKSSFTRMPNPNDHHFHPVPTPNTVNAADGNVLTVPSRWILLQPGDAALTRRVKTAAVRVNGFTLRTCRFSGTAIDKLCSSEVNRRNVKPKAKKGIRVNKSPESP